MKRTHGLMAALTLFFFCATVSVAPAQDPEGKKTLRDVAGVYLSVKEFDPAVKEAGLAREALEADVKAALQDAEIKVLAREAMLVTPGKPTLEVQVTIVGPHAGLYAYTLTVGLSQEVKLEREPNIRTRVATWSVEATGTVGSGKLRTLAEPVKQLVGMFVNDYLAANPVNETKTSLPTNVFSGPGGVFKILGVLAKGETLSIFEERNGWYRITSGAVAQGWIPKTFTEKAEATDPAAPVEASRLVTEKGVQDSPIQKGTLKQPARVYSGPGTLFDLLGNVSQGSTIDLFEERNGWYRIADGVPYGWIHRSSMNMPPNF